MDLNDAIEELLYQEDMRGKGIDYQVNNLVIATAVEALKEIQQYRAIGTAEEIKDILQIISEGQDDVDESGISTGLLHTLLEYAEYKNIGTVEECREARERQRGKKPLQGEPYTWISLVRIKGRYRDVRKTSYHHICPNCRENVAMDMNCCKYCGQAISWESDTP